jgi:hypothetical protein
MGLRQFVEELFPEVTLPRQTGPDVKFEHHLEEGHDEEDAEAVRDTCEKWSQAARRRNTACRPVRFTFPDTEVIALSY